MASKDIKIVLNKNDQEWIDKIKETLAKLNRVPEPTPIYDTLVDEFWPVVWVKLAPGGIIPDRTGEDIDESIY